MCLFLFLFPLAIFMPALTVVAGLFLCPNNPLKKCQIICCKLIVIVEHVATKFKTSKGIIGSSMNTLLDLIMFLPIFPLGKGQMGSEDI